MQQRKYKEKASWSFRKSIFARHTATGLAKLSINITPKSIPKQHYIMFCVFYYCLAWFFILFCLTAMYFELQKNNKSWNLVSKIQDTV